MVGHGASILSFPQIDARGSTLGGRHHDRAATTPDSDRLDLGSFVRLLEREGLADRLPHLELRVQALSNDYLNVFGFTFDPSEIRIPKRDVPRLLLGIRERVFTRPLVIHSPSVLDAIRLGLQPSMPMLTYRFECLARSGLRFKSAFTSWIFWKDLRSPRDRPLADEVRRVVGPRLSASSDLAAVYEGLPPGATIAERLGAAPQFLLVGRNRESAHNRVLATRADGTPVVKVLTGCRSPAFAMERGCRFLSPEAALLLLGWQDNRDGDSSLLACEGPIWLSALDPFGRVPMLQSEPDGVVLSTGDPRRNEPFDRLPATSE